MPYIIKTTTKIMSKNRRSVSHDSYFDTLQNSQNNSEGSLLDLSEIQLNFELEESEMRIFSEDESLVSSPRITKDAVIHSIRSAFLCDVPFFCSGAI